jgi:hypothetical protein
MTCFQILLGLVDPFLLDGAGMLQRTQFYLMQAGF